MELVSILSEKENADVINAIKEAGKHLHFQKMYESQITLISLNKVMVILVFGLQAID